MKKNVEHLSSGNASSDQPAFHPSSFHPSTPKRRFGQNFLVDRGVMQRIVDAFDPRSDQTVIEIGPGRGALTTELVKKAGRVVAIEFDRDLASKLRGQFAAAANFTLIEADALTIDFCEAIQPARTARVVANLPYNIGTAILQCLIEQRSCISDMTLMLQREVVDRITAPSGSSERGYLSGLRMRPRIAAEVKDEKLLWQVVSAGFAHPRKTILNNLRKAPESIQELLKKRGGASIVLCEAGIPPLRRAETLALEEWALLVNAMAR
ncbi:MAG: hypothetical protein DMF72_16560 [Acidobacteria bacterium]|nr:MAG: hypothetical protein DMF72_16560 [Acidobacteriota bacterium]